MFFVIEAMKFDHMKSDVIRKPPHVWIFKVARKGRY